MLAFFKGEFLRLFVERKALGRTRGVAKVPYELDEQPSELGTLRELIVALVRHEVAEFEAGFIPPAAADNTQDHAPEIPSSLPQRRYTEAELAELLESGKISFGYTYNSGKVDLEQAILVALQAVEDGLVRVFINNEEVSGLDTGLDTRLRLKDGDMLTLLRLTFLTGQY
ncbi:MAG: hypothetical protein Q4P66_01450 [Actinomycetaceae bacterium]|nr:hypothetical protein [Actinomycetaceae bacterium]